MTKKELRQIAKEKLMTALAIAYYQLEDEDFTEEEKESICQYMKQYGTSMGKAIGEQYYTL